jgi:hypothetical protein
MIQHPTSAITSPEHPLPHIATLGLSWLYFRSNLFIHFCADNCIKAWVVCKIKQQQFYNNVTYYYLESQYNPIVASDHCQNSLALAFSHGSTTK